MLRLRGLQSLLRAPLFVPLFLPMNNIDILSLHAELIRSENKRVSGEHMICLKDGIEFVYHGYLNIYHTHIHILTPAMDARMRIGLLNTDCDNSENFRMHWKDYFNMTWLLRETARGVCAMRSHSRLYTFFLSYFSSL